MTCKNLTYLWKYQCLGECTTEGTYADDTKNLCSPCINGCKSCTGGQINECGSCSDGFFWFKDTTTCMTECPSGYYADTKNNLCVKCDVDCNSCRGAGKAKCLSCPDGKYLRYKDYNGKNSDDGSLKSANEKVGQCVAECGNYMYEER